MTTFSIRRANELVEARFGETQRDLAQASIQSVVARLRYANFHHHEIEKLLAGFQASHLDEKSLFEVAFGPDLEARDQYHELMDAIGAHAVACVQSIHSVADLLANAAFYCLRLDAGGAPWEPEKVDLPRVSKLLDKTDRLRPIKTSMDAMARDAAFVHVDALSNRAKHSSLVKATLNEDMTGARDERHEIRFQAFRRKKVDYPESRIGDVLGPAYDAASNAIVGVGNQLIAVLEA
jgi:hypothetical protein